MARWTCRTAAMALVTLAAISGGRPASAEFIEPSVLVSIDRVGPSNMFNNTPGLLQRTTSAETRAIAEFELGSLRISDLTTARLFLELTVNNPGGLQSRSYDVFLYAANGQADLFDYSAAGALLGRIMFTVPQAPETFTPIPFELDILSQASTFLGGEASLIGVRLNPIGENHFPTVLTHIQLQAIPLQVNPPQVIPEPSGVILLGLGLALIGGLRYHRRPGH